ncbi:MAG: HPr family phosphocarrier protein [Brachybacterium sp.]
MSTRTAIRTATVGAADGLHARPAAAFVKAAKALGIPVTITKGDKKPVSAASMLGVLGLGAGQGDEVVLSSDAAGADDALDGLVELLESEDG